MRPDAACRTLDLLETRGGFPVPAAVGTVGFMAAVLKVLKDDDDRWLVVLSDDRWRARQDSDDVVTLATRDTQTDAEQVAQDWAAQDWARSLAIPMRR